MANENKMSKLIRLRESKITCTGGVVFIGDGNTGKTHTALNLASFKKKKVKLVSIDDLKKSINLEFNYFIFHSNIEEYQVTTSSQIFIMPGQKGRAEIGQGLAFEDAVDLYFSVSAINEVLTLVLTFDLTDIKTFQELEYWLERAMFRDIIKEYTSIVILGTHFDRKEEIVVTDEQIENAKVFVKNFIMNKKGIDVALNNIYSVKVSNISDEGLEDLKQAIYTSFITAFSIQQLISENNNLKYL